MADKLTVLSVIHDKVWEIRTICDGKKHYVLVSKNKDTESKVVMSAKCRCATSGDDLPEHVLEAINQAQKE